MFAERVALQRRRKERSCTMRKMILTLAVVLLAAPAWATVTIELEEISDGVIQIGYNATSETELVRAFALDIVATDGNITGIADYSVGDDNGGYGIFPGSFAGNITVNPTTGMVDSWVGNPNPYTPVAPAGDPDALGDIPGPAITIEMGSLYATAAPAKTGVLCTITIESTVSKVCVTGNAIRGNVVLENASEVIPAEVCIERGECFPQTNPTAYADWVYYSKPLSWCYARQCRGDADGKKQGSQFAGYMYVSTDDLGVLIAAWQVKEPPKGPGIVTVTGPKGEPGISADFNHAKQGSAFAGYMRVSTDDLAVLISAWQVKEPPKGPGVPGDCVPEPVEP
jgi:hypothetical protein